MPRWETLEDDLKAALGAELPTVPHAALDAARTLFRERKRPPVRFATPLFDGRASLSIAREGAGSSASFQRLFETEAHLIDVWEERGAKGESYLIGQVYDRAVGDALPLENVVLLAPSGETREVRTHEREWHAPGVPAGKWSIQLWLEGGEALLLSGLEVGA